MKRFAPLAATLMFLIALPVIAHHAAEGIVDDEIYAMIDEMVAGTPHGELTLDDLGGGMTEMTMDDLSVYAMEGMIEDDLLTYLAMLDGKVTASIVFEDDGSITLTVLQDNPEAELKAITADKEFEEESERATWGQVKAQYK